MFFRGNSTESLQKAIIDWLGRYQKRDLMRKNCYNIIDNFYNPNNQFNIIESIL